MKAQKTKRVMKEVEVVVEKYTICDKCGCKIETENFDAFECNFTYVVGSCYPEGGCGEEQSMDICQNCADDLVKLLIANGYNINTSDLD